MIVGLIVLTALTLLSLSGMRNTRIQERMAGNFRDRSLAFQGAEAALRDAEAYLRQADLPPFDGSMPGLIDRLAGPGSAASWSKYDWARASRPVGITLLGLAAPPRYVNREAFGHHHGRRGPGVRAPAGAGFFPDNRPRHGG